MHVVLILDPDAGSRILNHAQASPVWVIRSLANEREVRAIWEQRMGKDTNPSEWDVTLFDRQNESDDALLLDVLELIDQHCSDDSKRQALSSVEILGVVFCPHLEKLLLESGFTQVLPVDGGVSALS